MNEPITPFDPDEAREIASAAAYRIMVGHGPPNARRYADDEAGFMLAVDRLALYFAALNTYLLRGGRLPKAWVHDAVGPAGGE